MILQTISDILTVLQTSENHITPGPYQLQAAIAAAHAEERPWTEIVVFYDRLSELDPSPIVRLNRAVAVALAGDVDKGLALMDELEGLEGYHLLHAARADLLRRLDRRDEAAASYRRALELTANEPETRYLERRLAEVT
jgi:RNA polymerase sigma-70 factor (ECF subfamily)